MATEYKLSYTASEINRKLATVDETANALESNYYTSAEIDAKLDEVNTSVENGLLAKADLVEGKVPVEQLPDDIGGGLTEVAWEDIKNKPFGEVGNAKTECVGNAMVIEKYDPCDKKHDNSCKFTITQKLRIEVPVIFGARAEAGDACVDCEEDC